MSTACFFGGGWPKEASFCALWDRERLVEAAVIWNGELIALGLLVRGALLVVVVVVVCVVIAAVACGMDDTCVAIIDRVTAEIEGASGVL